MVKKKYIARKNSLTTAEVSRDVLKDILRLIMKSGQVIDVKEALKYPLSPVFRCPAKSSLMKSIDYTQVVEDNANANVGCNQSCK